MSQSLTAGLAKRLAEAADGFRDGNFYYFITTLEYDFDLEYAGADTDEAANTLANGILADKGGNANGYYKFGPYQTQLNDPDPALIDCDSMELSFIKEGLDPVTVTLEKDIDAIILSLSAFDKFFLPYYTRLYGVGVAADFRSQARSALLNKKPRTHANSTAYKASYSSQQSQSNNG